MGMKFQSRANDQPSQIVMHVRMLDEEASAQQEALGIVGVNLCYGAFFLSHVPEELVESLLDNLTTRRIEIDMLEFSGIEFRNVDNRIMALKLVQLGLSGAAMFGPNREVLQPSDVLHNKAVLVERGSFRPVTYVNLDMLESALAKFKARPRGGGQAHPLSHGTDHAQSAGRRHGGRPSRFPRARRSARRVRHDRAHLRLLRIPPARRLSLLADAANASASSWACRVFIELFDEKYYTQLPGGILENFGRLLKNDLKIYVYPLQRSPTDELQTIHTVKVKDDLQPLYDYLVRRGSFVQLDNYNPKYLSIFSRDVLKRIAAGDESWDEMVPPQVAEIIRVAVSSDTRNVKPAHL